MRSEYLIHGTQPIDLGLGELGSGLGLRLRLWLGLGLGLGLGSGSSDQLLLERVRAEPRLSGGHVGNVELGTVLAHEGREELEHLLEP